MKSIGTILIVSLCLACAATKEARGPRKAEAGFLSDYSILEEKSGPGARLRYLRGGVDWKRYDKMLVDPVQFWKTADEEAGLSETDKQTLVNYYHSTFYERMSKDYEMVSLPQPDTLRVSIVFTRLDDRNVTLDTVSTYVPQLLLVSEAKNVITGRPSFVGEAAFEGKITDAHTGELLGAAVGLKAGAGVVEALVSVGPAMIGAGALVTLVPVGVGFAVGRYALGLNPALLLGSIAGSMTSTPSLNLLAELSRSSVPALGYAGTYTFANVLLTFAGTVLMML